MLHSISLFSVQNCLWKFDHLNLVFENIMLNFIVLSTMKKGYY